MRNLLLFSRLINDFTPPPINLTYRGGQKLSFLRIANSLSSYFSKYKYTHYSLIYNTLHHLTPLKKPPKTQISLTHQQQFFFSHFFIHQKNYSLLITHYINYINVIPRLTKG